MDILLLITIFIAFMYVLCLESDLNKKINKKYRYINKKIKEINRLKEEVRKNKKEVNMLWSALDVVLEIREDKENNCYNCDGCDLKERSNAIVDEVYDCLFGNGGSEYEKSEKSK